MKYLNFLLLSVMCVMLASCEPATVKNTENPDSGTPGEKIDEPVKKLQKEVFYSAEGNIVFSTEYEYDSQGRKVRTSHTDAIDSTSDYTAIHAFPSPKEVLEGYKDSSGNITHLIRLTYMSSEKKKLKRHENKNSSGVLTLTYEREYDGDMRLLKIREIHHLASQLNRTTLYSYEAGDKVRIKFLDHEDNVLHYTVEEYEGALLQGVTRYGKNDEKVFSEEYTYTENKEIKTQVRTYPADETKNFSVVYDYSKNNEVTLRRYNYQNNLKSYGVKTFVKI